MHCVSHLVCPWNELHLEGSITGNKGSQDDIWHQDAPNQRVCGRCHYNHTIPHPSKMDSVCSGRNSILGKNKVQTKKVTVPSTQEGEDNAASGPEDSMRRHPEDYRQSYQVSWEVV